MQAARGASLNEQRPADEETTPATARKPRVWLFALVAIVAWATDQTTKWLAVEHLTDQPARPLVGDVLQLYLTYNPGAAFNLGINHTWVFTLLAIIATAVIVRLAVRLRSTGWAWALGLIGGGVVGNLTDRLFRPPATFRGHVVDFLMLPNWPVFNVADICLNIGVGLVVVLTFAGIGLDGTRERR